MNLTIDVFTKLDKQWALLAAGTPDDHNAMTVSWGGMGTLWGKPVVTVYVRPSRHTMSYMEKNGYFTLSFYGEEYRRALALMGSRSGRDIDKDAAAGLQAEAAGESVSYKEAELTILCKKIYQDDFKPENIPEDIKAANYDGGDWHRMYIGEVVDIIKKA